MNARPSRFRRIAKWMGSILSCVILLAWITTIPTPLWPRLYAYRQLPSSDLWLSFGQLFVQWPDYAGQVDPEALAVLDENDSEEMSWEVDWANEYWSDYLTSGSQYVRYCGFVWPYVGHRDAFRSGCLGFPDAFVIRLPFWFPLLVAAVPTTVLWHRDRRRSKSGHCPCGYNLTGNESGICPECGTAVGSGKVGQQS